jgi:hypothetical protein
MLTCVLFDCAGRAVSGVCVWCEEDYNLGGLVWDYVFLRW